MNMWKTVSARIRGAKSELVEMGEDTEGMIESTATLRDMIKGMTGFDIMEDEETFKSIYEIVVGIGEKWKDLSDIQQAGLLEKLAGKTQANTLASALNNIDILKEAYESAEESAGSAMREQAHFEEGIQYSINQFNASVEAFSHTLIDSDILKWFIDLGTTGVEALDKLTQKLTMFPAIITGITAAFSFVKGKNFFEAPINGIIDRTNALQQYTASMNVGTGMNYNKAFIKNLFGASGLSNAQLATQTNANRIINEFNKISPNFLSTYTPNADEIKAIAESLGIVDEEATKAAQSMINLGQVTVSAGQQGQSAFKGMGSLLSSIGKTALSIGATMAISFAINEAVKAYDNYIHKFENAKRDMENAKTSAEGKKKDLEGLISQQQEIQHRLEAINSMDGAKLARDGEKEKLEEQNLELERQIALKRASLKEDAKSSYDASKGIMTGTVIAHDNIDIEAMMAGQTRREYMSANDMNYYKSPRVKLENAVPLELKYYREALKEREKLLAEQDRLSKNEKGEFDEEVQKKNADALKELEEQLNTNQEAIDSSKNSLIEWSNSLNDAADSANFYAEYGHILDDTDKATIALAESTKESVTALMEQEDIVNGVADSQQEVNKAYIKSAEQLQTQKERVDSLVSSYKELLSLMTQGDGLDVTLDDEQLKKYGNALEYVNGVYKLNTEKLFEQAELNNQKEIIKLQKEKQDASMHYLQNISDIAELEKKLAKGESTLADGTTIKKRIADLKADNELIAEQNKVANYQISQLQNVTSAYQKWMAVSGQDTDAKTFTGVQDASKSVLELMGKGKIGLDSYKMAVDFLIPEGVDKEDSAAVKKYIDKNIKPYFTEDETGIKKFMKDATEKGIFNFDKETGDYTLASGMSTKEMMKRLGWSEDTVRAMFDQLKTYGADFEWDIEGLHTAEEQLMHTEETLAELNKQKDEFTKNGWSEKDGTTIEELDDQIQKATKHASQLKSKLKEETASKIDKSIEEHGGASEILREVKLDEHNGNKTKQEISKTIAEKLNISTQIEVDLYTQKAEQKLGYLKRDLKDLEDRFNKGEISETKYTSEVNRKRGEIKETESTLELLQRLDLKNSGIPKEETVERTNTLLGEIKGVLEGIKTAVGELKPKEEKQGGNAGDTSGGTGGKGSSGTGGKSSGGSSSGKGGKGNKTEEKKVVKIEYDTGVNTNDAMGSLDNLDKKAKETGKTVDNISKPRSLTMTDNLGSVGAHIDALIEKINNLIHRMGVLGSVRGDYSGDTKLGGRKPRAKGNVFAEGNAFARGNDIVGEQGRELVVDPNRGIWYTVGNSGTEMIDLPKDAIIYSHNQTEALLKSGVTTRGKSKGRSFAEGTKYAPTPEEMKKYIWGNIDLQHRQPYFYTDEDGWDHVNTVLGTHKFSRGLHFALAGLAQGDEVYQIDDGALQWYADQLTAQSLDPDTILSLDKQGFTDDAGNWLHDLVAYVGTNAEEAERISQIMHVISDEYERSIGTYTRGNAFANGTLVGERGRELIVDPNSGRWYTVGDYGSEMVNLPKDAIVYNHQQTEDLLKNGHTGRGHSTGASFADGNAFAGKNDGGSILDNIYDRTRGKFNMDRAFGGSNSSSANVAKSAEKAAKSAEKAADSAKKSADEAKQTIDWIERAIEVQNRALKKQKDIYENEYEGYDTRLTAVDQYREQLEEKLNVLTEALDRRNEKMFENEQELIKQIGDQDKAEVILKRVLEGDVDPGEWLEDFQKEFGAEGGQKVYDIVVKLQTNQKEIEDLEDQINEVEKDDTDAQQEAFKMRLNIIKAEKELIDYQMDVLQHNLDMKDILGKLVVEQDYQDMIDQTDEVADNLREQLEVLEEQADSLDPTSEAYASVQSDIYSIKKDLLECEKQQAEWNDKIMRLPIERLDKYIGMLENIKKDLQNWISERDTLNIETLGQTMSAQFSNLKDIAKAYQDQEQKWFKLRANYEWGSDKYEEATNEMQNCQDSISSIVQEMEELTAQFLKLPIDKISKINEKLQNINAAEQRVLDDYDTALSAVLSKFDQLIDKRNDEIDILNKRYDEMIKPYQDQLDLLNEQNEAKQMQYNIDKAQYDLDKARQQKNVQVVRNGRIVYESDPDALKSAQDNLNNAKHDKAVYDLQQQIDALEKERDSKIEPLEKEIEKLEDARNRWQTFEDERTFEKEAAEAIRLFGKNWEKAIEGTINNPHSDDREYNLFSKGHIELDRNITATEKQMEMNDKMMDLMTRYSDAYMSGEMTLDELKSQYAKLFADYQSDGGLVSQEALAAELAFNKAKDMADALAKNNIATTEQYKLFGDTKRLDEIGSYTETYKGLQKTWDQMAADIKAQTEELKRLYALAEEIAAQRRSSGGSRSSGDSDGGGGEWSKNPTGYGAGTKYNPYGKGTLYEGDAVFTGKSLAIDSGGGDTSVHADSVTVISSRDADTSHKDSGPGSSSKSSGKSHYNHSSASGPASDPELHADGLAGGIIGNIPPTEKFKKLQAMGLKPLEPDEVPAFLHVGEGVVNAIQQSNILKSVGNAFKAGVASIPADAVKSVENNYNFDCQFGDFILPGVEDTNGFASAMKNNFESIMNQQFSKIF